MKVVYFVLGMIMTAIGCIGIVLPILPTTPFLLVALYCFTRSSDRARDWFIGTSIYKNHIHDFVQTRSMTLKTKVTLLAFASTMLMIAFFMMNNIYGRATIIVLMIIKYYYFIFRIKTIKAGEEGTVYDK